MKTTKKMIAMLLTIAMIWTVAGVSFAEEVPQNTEQPVVEATQAPVVVVETPAEAPAAQATEAAQPEEPAQQPEVAPETAAPAETVAVTEENTPEPTVESSVTEQPAATSEAATEIPVITETPTTETPATETLAVTETPAATETPAVDATTLPNVSIVIRCTNSKPITVGDTVKLTAEITGIDWHECTLQWQYLDGDEWKNASSGNDITYSYVLTDSNLNTTWRLAVTIG